MYKKTKQRQLINEILKGYKKPISAEEIFEIISKKMDNVALSTVYRNINIMVENGTIIKTHSDNIALFSLNTHLHQFKIECEKCHKQLTVKECPCQFLENTLLKDFGFKIDEEEFKIVGYCNNCR